MDVDYEDRISGDYVDVGADEYVTDPNAPDPTIPIYIAAVATGEDTSSNLKICVYWSEVEGATGYNVYRATVSGGQNYSNPLNGSTPVTTLSYPEGNMYIFTDTGDLEAETEYFYTVTALGSWSESNPSAEASATPDINGIPWDSGDPDLILPSVREAFPDDPIPDDTLTAGSPDGRYYSDGSSEWFTMDVYWDPRSNTVIRDGEADIAVPGFPTYEEDGGQQLLGIALRNDQTGPYRGVRTSSSGYRGVRAKVTVPGTGSNLKLNNTKLPNTSYWTKDTAYIYITFAAPKGSVEAGIGCYTNPLDSGGSVYRWRLYMASTMPAEEAKYPGQKWYDEPRVKFFNGPAANVPFSAYISSVKDGELKLSVGEDTSVLHFPFLKKTAKGVKITRIHSIGQNNLKKSQYASAGYMRTGSFYLDSRWLDGHILRWSDGLQNAPLWTTRQTGSSNEGSWPLDPVIVNWNTIHAYWEEIVNVPLGKK
jgi:hypothetical protein